MNKDFKPRKSSTDYAYLGEYIGLARTCFGPSIALDTRNPQNWSIITHGIFERKVAATLDRLLKPGMKVLDFGANIGFFTLLAAKRVGPQGHVHACEPNPNISGLLRKSVMGNGMARWVTVHEVAAYHEDTELAMTWSDDKHGGGRLLTANTVPDQHRATIEARTVDNLLAGVDRIDLVKMDCEGSEPYALAGMQALLTRSPGVKLVTEWNSGMIRTRGGDVDTAIATLKAHFRRIEHIADRNRLAPMSFDDLRQARHVNVVLQ